MISFRIPKKNDQGLAIAVVVQGVKVGVYFPYQAKMILSRWVGNCVEFNLTTYTDLEDIQLAQCLLVGWDRTFKMGNGVVVEGVIIEFSA